MNFREKLRAAGQRPIDPTQDRLFDVGAITQLPAIAKLPAPDRLKTLRTKFEDLFDIERPLRAAVFSVGSLETVRIIEGNK